jgi:uncharacterized membrane protein
MISDMLSTSMNETTKLPEHNEPTDKSVIARKTTLVHYEGPLPHPATLKQYDEIVPGAAERLISMAEAQASHRQDLESRVIRNDNLKSLLGTIFGFVIALVGFVGGLYAALKGQPFWGGAVSIGTLASVVIAFIYGTRHRQQELRR